MGKLKEFNGIYCESDYEYTFIELLKREGWKYLSGKVLKRSKKTDVLISSDFVEFISSTNKNLTGEEIKQIFDTVRLVGSESDFETLHKVYNWLVDGIQFIPNDGLPQMVKLIDFEHPDRNIFRLVNQLEIEYTNQGQKNSRIPDVLLYVNGIPLCITELKNPTDARATIYNAWEQINIRYWRDIPHLLHYCPLACISDGVKTRLGTVRTPYEHFYAWRRVNDGDEITTSPFAETEAMIKGVYSPKRFLELFRDYIYFQDSIYDAEEVEIVCRYPQFFATRRLKQSIVKSVEEKSGKGGTYFGATGCGKTFTMAFLARQLSLRCTDIEAIGSPTIILIVDRDELQKQGAKLFTKSKEFLNLGEVSVVKDRAHLRQELGARQSGGFYICTIQKFCDREEDKIGLINDRQNIICFSDEAHRTQLEHAKKIRFSQDTDENMKAMLSKPYAKVLREAFPQATFVGFTGTPIAETYQTFGDEIDRYTMDQAVADGLTVSIKYHPRIAKVLFDTEKIKEIEEYYKKCADDGATVEDIVASKRAMSSMEVILGEPSRLERLATDIHGHYTAACDSDPGRIQKAMIVCSNRKIAFDLLKTFKKQYPEWFIEKQSADETNVTEEELKSLTPMPFIAMVASVGSNDPEEMYNYLGGVKNNKRSKMLDMAFKQDKSNFRIAIVVDMWITGFDVPTLTYLYNDKPLQKHLLIQTISRVNRKYPGKEFGMVIDYIGIRNNMREAMKIYGGDVSVAPTSDDVEQATNVFRDHLGMLKALFAECDFIVFINPQSDSVERYKALTNAAEYIFSSTTLLNVDGVDSIQKVSFKTYFLKLVKRMRTAYDICQPSGELSEEESSLAQCFMAIAGLVRKMSGTSDIDADIMNRTVEKMVTEALQYSNVESVLDNGEEEDIFSPEYFEKLSDVKLPATKLEVLIKMIRKEIKEYGKTNRLAAQTFQEMLERTIEEYHERRKTLSAEEASDAQKHAVNDIIASITKQALEILQQLNESRDSFRKMGLTFEEKAFYDILIALRDQYNFEYGVDEQKDGVVINNKCKILAQKVKEIIDTKSSFADWLNNENVRNQLKLEIKICLVKTGYPPQYSPEVFTKVMEQVENFEENATLPNVDNILQFHDRNLRYAEYDNVASVADKEDKD
ncbi:HsdR family type I site-specific deoxyribonuclease [Veillonella sp.]|uniref:type I restriction endonuclease subunit R n=1 Tax=Veillonella sp. TaxID=1926307 RepID=UPI002580A0BB|nr:HsdR family type I site-specific deoxyribonuclease [Veillonella sp.]MBS6484945.1 type I restriction endonuclease subunit R [Veillonella sp.]